MNLRYFWFIQWAIYKIIQRLILQKLYGIWNLKCKYSLDQGENARLSSFIGAIAIADLVKTTLGPKGMDKILQKVSEHDQSISVTNDGATILRSVMLDNPAAKVLVDIARVQDDEVGDGTTSVAVLCGELL